MFTSNVMSVLFNWLRPLSHDILILTLFTTIQAQFDKRAQKFKFEEKIPFQDRKLGQEMDDEIFSVQNQVSFRD